MNRLVALFYFLTALASQSASYYVTQAGAGAANGTSVGNAWSVANFNASSTPAEGDTVYFSGTISSDVSQATSGNAAMLTLDFAAATVQGRILPNVGGAHFSTTYLGGITTGSLFDFGASYTAYNIVIANWRANLASDSGALFIEGRYTVGITVTNNFLTNVAAIWFSDTTGCSNITIINNYCASPTNNLVSQVDIISWGDAPNMVIQGNMLVQRTPGHASVRHNDVIQCYQKGGGASGTPYGCIIRYNWLELDVRSGSGDTSWLMLENMANVSGVDACKIYGNVFVGTADDVGSNNGIAPNGNSSSAVFRFHNNTVIRKAGPDNTIRFLSPGILYSANNVCRATSAGGGTYVSWTMTEATDWNYNWFYNFDSPSATYTGANGASNTDPLFMDYSGNNFSLQVSSPCINAGDSGIGSEYNQGIAYGATWPNPTLVTRSAWDIGAYEYSNSARTTRGGFVTSGGKITR